MSSQEFQNAFRFTGFCICAVLILMMLHGGASGHGVEDNDEHGPPAAPLAAVAAGETLIPGWDIYDVAAGTKPSFDFDANGKLHVMGMTEEIQGVVWYAASDSVDGSWSPEVISNGYFYGPGDLRVDHSGTAHLAWHDHDDEDPNHMTITATGTRRLNRIASPGTHNGWDNALEISPSGKVYQTSVDPVDFGASTSLEFGTFDGTNWDYQTVPRSGAFMYGLNTAVAVDENEQPHIVFCDCANFTAPGDLKYARRSGNQWDISTVASGGINGRFPVVQVDDANRPVAAWIDIDANDRSRGFVRFGILDGDQWQIETVDELQDIRLGFGGARKLVSLEIDSSGKSHLAYGDERVLKYATRDGRESWDRVTVLESEEPRYNGHVVLRLDSADDAPAIVFWQPAGSSGLVRMASPKFTPVQAGDANGDYEFNQLDLIQVLRSRKYRSGQPASWAEGDWDAAPGGRSARPPKGDGVFDSEDIIAALAGGFWLKGSYRDPTSGFRVGLAAVSTEGKLEIDDLSDPSVAVRYNDETGSVSIETNFELSSIKIESTSGIFSKSDATNLDGLFDFITENEIFKSKFIHGFKTVEFGEIAETGLGNQFLESDMSVTGSYFRGGFVEESHVRVQVVPEPKLGILLLSLITIVLMMRRSKSSIPFMEGAS